MMHLLRFAILFLGLSLPLSGQRIVSVPTPDSLPQHTYTSKLLLQGVIESAPLVGLGILQSLHNDQVRELRYGYYPQFRHHYDDYLQFAPLVAQVGMRLAGLQGASDSPWQTFTADALASISMMAITSGIKYTARVRRPDGSTRNSFPSGHTAMAFTAATLLAQEYGQRYPWVSVAGYTMASAVGIGRLLNNRHWIGDVVTGAGLGILSGHLGYWMADRLFGGSGRRLKELRDYRTSDLQLYFPISLSTSTPVAEERWSLRQRMVGIGLHYTPPKWSVYLKAEAHLSLSRALSSRPGLLSSEDYHALYLRLGVGRTFKLWQELALQVSPYGTLRQGLEKQLQSPSATATILQGSVTALALGLELAPQWRLTERVGLRLPFSLDYSLSPLHLVRSGSDLPLSHLRYSVGSALTVFL